MHTMKDQFKRILELVRKTGNTMIVTDTDGSNAYVVMDIDQYEMMLDDTSVFDELDEENFEQDDSEFDIQKSSYRDGDNVDDWQIPEEFVIDDPEGGLTDEPDVLLSDKSITQNTQDVDIWSTMQPANETGSTWDISQMNASEIDELEKQYKMFAENNVQQGLPKNNISKKNSEQIGSEDNFSEEQFYLEPIE